jgi:hypothetical protein
MDPIMMNAFGLIQATTPKEEYKNGSGPFYIKLARFLTKMQRASMQGTELGPEALSHRSLQ